MNQIKYIIKILLSLLANPSETWEFLATADTDAAKPELMQRNYYYPLLGCMALEVMLCDGFHFAPEDETFSIQAGMLHMVPQLVAFFVGPYLTMLVCKPFFKKVFDVTDDYKDRLHLFIFYCTSFLMALEMVTALAPSIKFISFGIIYILYLTFTGVSFLHVSEKREWIFATTSAFLIWLCPHIIASMLTHMQG